MANIAASKCDTRLVINIVLTVTNNKYGSLGVRNFKDSSLLGSIDSKQMDKNSVHLKNTSNKVVF